MRRSVAALAAATPLALLPLVPATAAEPLACGTEVTEDVTLTADLVCDDVALYVGASGTTIDLAGHTITARVAVQPGFGGGERTYRVVGGTIAGGVVVADQETTVERTTFVDGATATCVNGPLTVRDSTFRSSSVTAGPSCPTATIERSTFRDSDVQLRSAGGTIRDNTFRGGEVPISVIVGSTTTVARNRVSGATTGIELRATGSGTLTVEDNVVRHSDVGIRYHAGSDYGTPDVTIGRNTVLGNRSHGIDVLLDLSDVLGGTDLTLEANRAIGNGGDGIRAEITAERVVYDDPTAPYHDLELTVRRNMAVANRGVGITVPDDEGVVDEGGNRAVANRGGGCRGVACR